MIFVIVHVNCQRHCFFKYSDALYVRVRLFAELWDTWPSPSSEPKFGTPPTSNGTGGGRIPILKDILLCCYVIHKWNIWTGMKDNLPMGIIGPIGPIGGIPGIIGIMGNGGIIGIIGIGGWSGCWGAAFPGAGFSPSLSESVRITRNSQSIAL